MSWSVSAIGNPAGVAKQIEEQLAEIRCEEPEESIKNSVAAIISLALLQFPDNYAVRIDATGSQSHQGKLTPGKTNSLRLNIEPLYGFVH